MAENTQDQIPPELFGEIVKNQTEELNVRKEEIELRKQEDKHSFDFSTQALKAQAEDRKNAREYQKRARRDRYFFWSFVTVIITTIIIFALIFKEKAIAQKIIEALIYISTSGMGGYALGKNHGSKLSSQERHTD